MTSSTSIPEPLSPATAEWRGLHWTLRPSRTGPAQPHAAEHLELAAALEVDASVLASRLPLPRSGLLTEVAQLSPPSRVSVEQVRHRDAAH